MDQLAALGETVELHVVIELLQQQGTLYDRWIVQQFFRLDQRMTLLTDTVEQSLAQLKSDEADFVSVIQTLQAGEAAAQAALAAANQGQVANAAELQSVVDALNVSHTTLSTLVAQAAAPAPTDTPAPVDAPVDVNLTAPPAGSDSSTPVPSDGSDPAVDGTPAAS